MSAILLEGIFFCSNLLIFVQSFEFFPTISYISKKDKKKSLPTNHTLFLAVTQNKEDFLPYKYMNIDFQSHSVVTATW